MPEPEIEIRQWVILFFFKKEEHAAHFSKKGYVPVEYAKDFKIIKDRWHHAGRLPLTDFYVVAQHNIFGL